MRFHTINGALGIPLGFFSGRVSASAFEVIAGCAINSSLVQIMEHGVDLTLGNGRSQNSRLVPALVP